MMMIRKVGRLLVMEWSKMIQYRMDITFWVLGEAMVPVVALAIWYAVSTGSDKGFTPQEAVSYYVVVLFVGLATSAWHGYYMSQSILEGNIVIFLIRPFGTLWPLVVNNIIEKILKFMIPFPVFVILFIVMPQWFTSSMYDPARWLFFIVSILVAVILAFLVETIFGLIAFWTEDAFQIRGYKDFFEIVTSGILIPFALMPPSLATALSWLPFRSIISVPAEIITGQTSYTQSILFIFMQCAWIVGAFLVARILWVRGLKRYAVPGQ